MKYCQVFIIAMLIIGCFTQSCANLGNQDDRIEAGSLQLITIYTPQTIKQAGNQREHPFNIVFNIPVTSGYQITTSFSEYSLTSFASNSQDFSIRAIPQSQSSAKLIVLIDDDGTWTRMRISYLITARSDFFLGTFVGDGYFQPRNSNGELLFSYSLPVWNSQPSQATAIALLSGLRVITAELPLLKISNAKLNTTSGQLEVAVSYNSLNSFQYIHISYICFLSTSPLKFSRFDPSNPSTSTYQIVGIESFGNKQVGFSGVGFDGTGFLNCNGANCGSACILGDNCRFNSGTVLGSNCFLCGIGQKYVNGNCISTGGVKCGANQVFDGFQCVCIDGYFNVNNICYPSCGTQAYVDAKGNCQCTQGSREQPNQVVNPNVPRPNQPIQPIQNQPNRNNPNIPINPNIPSMRTQPTPTINKITTNPTVKICVKIRICRTNEVNIDGVCQCARGYALINGKCSAPFQCPVNTVWEAASYSCACADGLFLTNDVCGSCPLNSVWNGTSCNCVPGYQKINGQCKGCPANSVWNGISCTCNQGFVLINAVCSNCPGGSFWNGSGCSCQQGYTFVNNSCIGCPSNSVWVPSSQSCQCLSGFYLLQGSCITCPVNTGWNGNSCVCLSGFFQTANGCAACPASTTWNGSSCVCPGGQNFINGVCSSCGPNSQWNGNTCICGVGFYKDNRGVCIACQANAEWNGQQCQCKATYYLINGACQQCPVNNNWNGQKCICNNNYYLINGICTQCGINSAWNGTACACLSGSYLINNSCQQCGANSVWTGSACACLTGSYPFNGICKSCQANAGWNGNSCVCLTGFYPSGNDCISCPTGTTWNGNTCLSSVPTCPNKSTWNGTACVCSAGFFNISSSCLPCDPNSVYNSTAQTCQCKDGFFGNYQLCTPCDPSCLTCQQSGANSCTTCRAGTALVIGACLAPCAAGTFRQGPICQACPAFCQSCSGTSSCTQCQTGYSPNQSGVCIASNPTSKIQLSGSVVNNGMIFQGVTMSQMPTSILVNNCDICADLLFVNITSLGVTITSTVDYVVNSQYWFVITFNYGAVGIVPLFNFTVQINSVHAALFTQADMNQKLLGNIDPVNYPINNDAVPVKPVINDTNQISQNTGKPGTGRNPPPSRVNTTTPTQPARGRLSTDPATLAAIFG